MHFIPNMLKSHFQNGYPDVYNGQVRKCAVTDEFLIVPPYLLFNRQKKTV
jgi:hypothetical protein